MRSRPGVITRADLSNVTLAPNDQALRGETHLIFGINFPEIEYLRGLGSTGHARKEKGDRERHEGDDGRDLKGALVSGGQGSVGGHYME